MQGGDALDQPAEVEHKVVIISLIWKSLDDILGFEIRKEIEYFLDVIDDSRIRGKSFVDDVREIGFDFLETLDESFNRGHFIISLGGEKIKNKFFRKKIYDFVNRTFRAISDIS